MNLKPPAARPLPHKQEILERILAHDQAPARRRRRTWLIPVGAAASIALVCGGVLIATGQDKTSPTPADRISPSAPADIHITLRPLTTAERSKAAKNCPLSGFHPRPVKVRYRPVSSSYAMKVRNPEEGPTDFAIQTTVTPGNLSYVCTGTSGTLVAGGPVEKAFLQPPDATHPAVPLAGQHRSLPIDFDNRADLLMSDGWYRVDDRVASVRQRWILRGKPSPWYVADAVDGLVFVRSWTSAALKPGEQVRIETQVLDHDGRLLDAPAGRQPGGSLKPSPGTTRVERGTVARPAADGAMGFINFR